MGVGIFGTFTGYLANLFLAPSKTQEASPATPSADSRHLDVVQFRTLVAQQQATIDEINLLL